jgi:hypothetical protein
MHWTYKNQIEFDTPPGSFGFVYRISDLESGRKYIGRKYLTAAKTTAKRILKKDGTRTTKKKKTRVESDWQKYMGSCKPLLEEISRKGKDKFKFEILAFGFTKGQVNFMECWIQMRCNVIIDDAYYNDAIGSGQFRGVKFTDEFKNALQEIKL